MGDSKAAINGGNDEKESVIKPLLSPPVTDLGSFHLPRGNSISQTALVGANLCPIESLDYEVIENDICNQDRRIRDEAKIYQYICAKWTLCFLTGLTVSLVGFFINLAVHNVAGKKFVITSDMMLANRYSMAFGVFAVCNFVLVLFASMFTVFVSPAAAGSGIPEVKAYLNGVNAPDIFSVRTLIGKIVGSISAVGASLHVGKAGSMVHTASCIAALMTQAGSKKWAPLRKWVRFLNNDRDMRGLVTVGTACGIAAAFRAPVGGVLFAFEEMSSWWGSELLWRAFFSTAIVAIMLHSFINLCYSGKCGLFGTGGLIMYKVTNENIVFHLSDVPPVLVLAVIGGMLGALYNTVLEKVLRIYNRIHLKGAFYQILLACAISVFTSCLLFGLPWLEPCQPCPTDGSEPCPSIGRSGNYKKFQCGPGHYNDLASLIFNTNDDAIRNLFSRTTDSEFHGSSMLVFFITCFLLSILSYGVVVPSGLFTPVIVTGASYGHYVGTVIGSRSSLNRGLFAVLGSASLLGGSMRMTVSLCVILLEITNNMLVLPLVMLVLLVSKTVADGFNGNIYDALMKLKGFPYLETYTEPYMSQLTVSDVITGPLRYFNGVEKVQNIVNVLKSSKHNGFPVIDEPLNSEPPVLIGLILRSHVVLLLKMKAFVQTRTDTLEKLSTTDFMQVGPTGIGDIDDVALTDEETEMFVDLRPFSNTSPYTVVEMMSLSKALTLFRELGLRHMLVVPKKPHRQAVVGVLTRHDFMEEHILRLHPSLVTHKWRRKFRFHFPCFSKPRQR